jgi:hypothetical protein
MIRTQIQLPEGVHLRLKRVARQREWSLAEAIRRAAEEFLDRHPSPEESIEAWHLPQPRDMGTRPMSAAEIKRLAQVPEAEERFRRERTATTNEES